MSHTANPTSVLGHWCRKVDAMKPGQRLEVDRRDLQDIATFEHNFATFTPAHRILGNIIGSAYTHSFHVRPDNGNIVFTRHAETGETFYHEPDEAFRLANLRRRAPPLNEGKGEA